MLPNEYTSLEPDEYHDVMGTDSQNALMLLMESAKGSSTGFVIITLLLYSKAWAKVQ